VPYPAGPHAAPPEERDRDWGIAAARVAVSNPEARSLAQFAAERLSAAVKRWPDDAEAWEALAAVRGTGGDRKGAVEAARAAVAADPHWETALGRLSLEARLAGDLDAARPAADQLVGLNPTSLAYRVDRADVHLRRKDWPRAEADARAALGVQPLYWRPRLYLAVCRYQQADPAGAREEATTAAGLIPTERLRAAYMRWYQDQTR
jgi:predicted Zn-dependent protease